MLSIGTAESNIVLGFALLPVKTTSSNKSLSSFNTTFTVLPEETFFSTVENPTEDITITAGLFLRFKVNCPNSSVVVPLVVPFSITFA